MSEPAAAAPPFRPEGFRPLELADREAVSGWLRRHPPEVSELTFTNLYMWAGKNRPAWAAVGEALYLLLSPLGHEPYLLPPVGAVGIETVKNIFAQFQAAGYRPTLERVPEAQAQTLCAAWPALAATPDRDNFDYVYAQKSLAELAGRKYSRKRNHIRRFEKENRWEYLPFSAEMVPSLLAMQEEWCALRRCEEFPGTAAEHRAIVRALEAAEALGFVGGAIAVEGKIQAFSLGERLNPTTAVIHVEKANPEIEGLYPAMTHNFVKRALAGAEWINREQDLGEPGLRQAKESFFPERMIAKSRVGLLG